MNNTARAMEYDSDKKNRLVGWLVSFAADDLGKAYELRAGRYLFSANDQRDNRTILVSEKSVATPHSALHASPKHKVMIQDIFSDSGTFITRSGTDKETQILSPTEVNHGDWIRIGDKFRFQVCLIDGNGR